jgi:hypothetical protein
LWNFRNLNPVNSFLKILYKLIVFSRKWNRDNRFSISSRTEPIEFIKYFYAISCNLKHSNQTNISNPDRANFLPKACKTKVDISKTFYRNWLPLKWFLLNRLTLRKNLWVYCDVLKISKNTVWIFRIFLFRQLIFKISNRTECLLSDVNEIDWHSRSVT